MREVLKLVPGIPFRISINLGFKSMSQVVNLQEVARQLRAAYSAGPIDPISSSVGQRDVVVAYEIQRINTLFFQKQGRQVAGKKIGLTSLSVQQQLGVDQPDFGVLFNDMQIADKDSVQIKDLIQPKIEGEIAIAFSVDMNTLPDSLNELVAAIDWIAPALEIVDSRIRDWKIGIVDTVADNASSALYVVGPHIKPEGVDVVTCAMELKQNGQLASQGQGAACLGSPYIAAHWLVAKMIELGQPIRAGEIVLTGALGPMVKVQKGARYELNIDGVGTCSVGFE
jgi:2-keto-4-pentenoate hydratase